MKSFFQKGAESVSALADKLLEEVQNGLSMFKEVVNGLPVFISRESSDNYSVEYDEKHYFVIPFVPSETGFALHTMRCLPKGVPEVNNLPKRRVFHFAHEHAEVALQQQMLSSARDIATENQAESVSSLESLANDIDALGSKLTYGMLLVGGVAAIFNPLLGAGIAAKALLPGVTGLLSKYGLRPAGEKMTRAQLEEQIKNAEKNVLQQFSESSTIKVINPVLQELDLTLRTDESEHDPLVDPNLANGSFAGEDNARWKQLTITAIYHVYKDVYQNPKLHAEAQLGPEDIRWFDVLFSNQED